MDLLFRFMTFLMRFLDPEMAHSCTIFILKSGIVPKYNFSCDQALKNELFGLQFENPIGLAAGFDKNAEVPLQMLGLGFGFVEIGSVTPQPQYGNQKPRIFRLSANQAIVNRLGFNNEGHLVVAKNLGRVHEIKKGIIGVNLGKNKNSKDFIEDYKEGVRCFGKLADYITINISSPNTPGLRDLQARENLDVLLKEICETMSDLCADQVPPLLVKVSPDLDSQEKADIAELVVKYKVDGLIATNTTISRQGYLNIKNGMETGGLSGQPLFNISTEVVRDFFRLTQGQIPIIGVGGVANGAQAYEKIRAGASLVQLYSALVYNGPSLIREINSDLGKLLRNDGIEKISDAVGIDA